MMNRRHAAPDSDLSSSSSMDPRQRRSLAVQQGGADGSYSPMNGRHVSRKVSKPDFMPAMTANLSSPTKKPSSSSSPPSSGLSPVKLVAIVAVALALLTGGYFLFVRYENKHDEAIRQEIRKNEIGTLSKDLDKKMSAMEEDNQFLKQRLQDLENAKASVEQEKKDIKESDEKLHEQIERMQKYKQHMHESIQLLSKRHLEEKFGPGPTYRVEISLAFDPESNVASMGGGDKFVIETASKDDMPHTVYWFLEQVDHKLYDGCSFHRNAGHVIQAGPASNWLTPPNFGLLKRFKEAGLEGVLFQEYSDKFPHNKYTMGFAGRPGGPDFYVSMTDNSRVHGPGGQPGYEDPDEADPCFAKIVDGFGAVDRMHQSSVLEGAYKHMEHNIAIESMRILSPEEYTKGGGSNIRGSKTES